MSAPAIVAFPSSAFADSETILSESFGTDTAYEIPGWDEEGTDEDDTTRAQAAEEGNDSASPDGGAFAKIARDEWICREVDAEGYYGLQLSYHWRGDSDAEGSGQGGPDIGIVEYSTNYDDCSEADWTTLKEHDMTVHADWSTQSAFDLPEDVNDREFLLRFRTDSSAGNEYLRVDGVLLTGNTYGSISGYKYDDEEYGLEDWYIYLYRWDGEEWNEEDGMPTDEDGYYTFEDLEEGTYAVCEQQEDGWMQLYPETAEESGVCVDEHNTYGHDVTLTGEDVEEKNFVNAQGAELYGYKWNDADFNGEWNREEELGLKDWTIYATPMMEVVCEDETCSEELVEDTRPGRTEKSAVTDEDGKYTFQFFDDEDEGGWWRVWEEVQTGWSQTYPGGVIEAYYYDVYIETDEGDYGEYDFGNWRWPVIEIFKWSDANRDGVRNEVAGTEELESPVADYPVAVGRVMSVNEGEEGHDVIETEIVALSLTGSNGIASIQLNPDWFGGFEGLDQALNQGLMALEGQLGGWTKTYPTQTHNDQVNLSFRDGLSGEFHVDSFFDIFTEVALDGGVMNQGFVHDMKSEPVQLAFGNTAFLVISDEVVPSVGEGSVVIDWVTDRPATSRVIYDTVSHPVLGDAPDYGYAHSTKTFDTDPKVEMHKVTVEGLTSGTTYYYRTVSSASPDTLGSEGTFTTNPLGGPVVSGGGGGGGGGIAGLFGVVNTNTGGGQVLGAATFAPPTSAPVTTTSVPTSAQCVTAFLGPNYTNDPEQAKMLQTILVSEGFALEVNGVFDDATFEAVKGFQLKYADEILKPWGITNPTGSVYLTTRKKLNEFYCAATGQTFPLSAEEQAIIDSYKNGQSSLIGAQGVSALDSIQPDNIGSQGNDDVNVQDDVPDNESQVGTAAASTEETGGFWSRLRSFFGL